MRDTNDRNEPNGSSAASTRGRYTGPSAGRIAELLAAHGRVRFEQGWFWTQALCHESEQDQLSFRQRPDGDGLDVRCRSAGCSRERIVRRLEARTGESIWSAYSTEPRSAPAAQQLGSGTDARGSRSWRLALAPLVILLLAAPLVLGADLQVGALNAAGLGWTAWLVRSVLLNRRRAVAKGGRSR